MEKQSITTRFSTCLLLAGFLVLIFAVLLQEKFLLLAPNMLAPIGLVSGIIGFVKVKSKNGLFVIFAHFALLFWFFLYPFLLSYFIN